MPWLLTKVNTVRMRHKGSMTFEPLRAAYRALHSAELMSAVARNGFHRHLCRAALSGAIFLRRSSENLKRLFTPWMRRSKEQRQRGGMTCSLFVQDSKHSLNRQSLFESDRSSSPVLMSPISDRKGRQISGFSLPNKSDPSQGPSLRDTPERLVVLRYVNVLHKVGSLDEP